MRTLLLVVLLAVTLCAGVGGLFLIFGDDIDSAKLGLQFYVNELLESR